MIQRILICSKIGSSPADLTKWVELSGDTAVTALGPMIQYFLDSLNDTSDFLVWFIYEHSSTKTTFNSIVNYLGIRKRDFYERLQNVYTGRSYSEKDFENIKGVL